MRKNHEGIKRLSDRILNSQRRLLQLCELHLCFQSTPSHVYACVVTDMDSLFFLIELSPNSCRNSCILSIVTSCQQMPLDSSPDRTIEKPFIISHHMTPNTCITHHQPRKHQGITKNSITVFFHLIKRQYCDTFKKRVFWNEELKILLRHNKNAYETFLTIT